MRLRFLLVPISLVIAAVLVRIWLAPLATSLPANYQSETHYSAQVRFRTSPDAEWQAFPLLARRVDQALLVNGDVVIIQGESHWTAEDGTPTYEPIGLYGVDRLTRRNLPGYGDDSRHGQFLFPTHLEQETYDFWDPYYVGPRTATFDHVDQVDGLTVFVFNFTADGLDDTDAYLFLPDVPERYRTLSRGEGQLWIEPVSGVVVDFTDVGTTSFIDVTTGETVADFYHWTAHYTDETRAEQMALAHASRFRICALETWLPLGILLLVAAWFCFPTRRFAAQNRIVV